MASKSERGMLLLGEAMQAEATGARAAEQSGVVDLICRALQTSRSDGHVALSAGVCRCISALMVNGSRDCQRTLSLGSGAVTAV
eukprot:scaffold4842_cov10-Prasinocladus_malaysianus.AAC.1